MSNTRASLGGLRLIQYYQTKNRSYTKPKLINPSGIVVHSSASNNPYIRRYVGPDDGILGKNKYGNHWNKATATKSMHGFIGKVADGSIAVYQTLPWNYHCNGVGKGKKGSYNSTHIQFEICEDALENEAYYKEVFAMAARLCAYLCQEYGIKVENVVGHYEAHAAGYGSNHEDPRHWQRKFGGSMDAFRAEVAALISGGNIPADVTISTTEEEKPAKAPETGQDAAKVQGGVNVPTLRNGAQGTAVKVLQRLLIANGAKLSRYGADGKYGAETEAAVKAFQTAHNLTPDGICGPLTWAALAG